MTMWLQPQVYEISFVFAFVKLLKISRMKIYAQKVWNVVFEVFESQKPTCSLLVWRPDSTRFEGSLRRSRWWRASWSGIGTSVCWPGSPELRPPNRSPPCCRCCEPTDSIERSEDSSKSTPGNNKKAFIWAHLQTPKLRSLILHLKWLRKRTKRDGGRENFNHVWC